MDLAFLNEIIRGFNLKALAMCRLMNGSVIGCVEPIMMYVHIDKLVGGVTGTVIIMIGRVYAWCADGIFHLTIDKTAMVSSPIQTDAGFKDGGITDNAMENDIQRQWCFNPNGLRSSQGHFFSR